MKKSINIICKGRVQGVFFRASTKEKADEMNLVGWVRNETNGDVFVHVEGEEPDVDALIAWCRIGPRMSVVEELIITAVPSEPDLSGFKIRH